MTLLPLCYRTISFTVSLSSASLSSSRAHICREISWSRDCSMKGTSFEVSFSKLLFLLLRKLGIFLHCNFLLFERINIFKDFLNDPKGGHILLFSRVLNIVSEHSLCNYSFLDSHTRSRRWNVYLDSVSTVSAEGWFSREERGAYRGGVSGRRFAYLSPRVPRCQRWARDRCRADRWRCRRTTKATRLRNRNLGWFFIGGSVFELCTRETPYRPAALSFLSRSSSTWRDVEDSSREISFWSFFPIFYLCVTIKIVRRNTYWVGRAFIYTYTSYYMYSRFSLKNFWKIDHLSLYALLYNFSRK